MKVLLLATLTAIARGAQPPQANTRTNTAHAAVSNITDVFIIPHTHADTGWMITAEEYYKQLVRPILDSQVRALASNASWRYCWAEIMYFARWWRDQSPAVRAQARQLAVAGQLEFVEGGWTQADELVVSLDERVQNLEHGHQWLLENIAYDASSGAPPSAASLAASTPRQMWKLDPFGGSALSATIAAQQRFDAITKMRLPSELKGGLQASGDAELLWRPSFAEAGGVAASVPPQLLHVLTSYSGLTNQGFDFDQYRVATPPINDSTVEARSQALASYAQLWSTYFSRSSGGRLLALPYGGDFRWQNASYWYRNMTLLMTHVNAAADSNSSRFGIRLRWATPSEYFHALHSARGGAGGRAGGVGSDALHSYLGDFTPYDGQPVNPAQGYETGILDSHPELKRAVRRTSQRARAAGMLRALALALDRADAGEDAQARSANTVAGQFNATGEAGWLTARQAVSLGVHHDAIPGTMESGEYDGSDPIHGGEVLQDYMRQLRDGANGATHSLAASGQRVMQKLGPLLLGSAVAAGAGASAGAGAGAVSWDVEAVAARAGNGTEQSAAAAVTAAGALTQPLLLDALAPPARLVLFNPSTVPFASVATVRISDLHLGSTIEVSAAGGAGRDEAKENKADEMALQCIEVIDVVTGEAVLAQLEPDMGSAHALDDSPGSGAGALLSFLARIPGLGFRSYAFNFTRKHASTRDRFGNSCMTRLVRPALLPVTTPSPLLLRSSCGLELALNPTDGSIVRHADMRRSGATTALRARFFSYFNTTSGAYFFTPDGNAVPTPAATTQPNSTVAWLADGPVVKRVWRFVGDAKSGSLVLHTAVRAAPGDALCGVVALAAGPRSAIANGSEVVLRFDSNISNIKYEPNGLRNPVVVGDNGLGPRPWVFNRTLPKDVIGGNYRAAVHAAHIASGSSSSVDASVSGDARTLHVELRRTHGVASLDAGALEVKLQRNVGHLIGPPGNDSVAAVAAIDVLLGGASYSPSSDFATSALALRAAVHEPPEVLLVRPSSGLRAHADTTVTSHADAYSGQNRGADWSALGPALPTGVRLQDLRPDTARPAADGASLVLLARFVNGGDEPRAFSMNEVFSGLCLTAGLRLRGMNETTLSGNRLRRDVQPLQWHVHSEAGRNQEPVNSSDAETSRAEMGQLHLDANVTLIPREVRTWSITFTSSQ